MWKSKIWAEGFRIPPCNNYSSDVRCEQLRYINHLRSVKQVRFPVITKIVKKINNLTDAVSSVIFSPFSMDVTTIESSFLLA